LSSVRHTAQPTHRHCRANGNPPGAHTAANARLYSRQRPSPIAALLLAVQLFALPGAASAEPGDAANATASARQLAAEGAALLADDDWRGALRAFRTAAETAAHSGDAVLAAQHYNNSARLHTRLGEFERAAEALDAAAAQIVGLARVGAMRAQTLLNRGDLALKRRRYAAAIDWLDRAEDAAGASPDAAALRAQIAAVRGVVLRQQGDFEAALAAYARAAALARELPRGAAGAALLALAERLAGESWLYRIEGEPAANRQRAGELLERALAAHRGAGDALSAAMAESHLGEHARLAGDPALAARRFAAALAVFERLGYRDGVGRMRLHLGFAASDRGDQPAALAHFAAARDIYAALGDREWQRVAWFGSGLARERGGDDAAAEKAYFHALELFESLRVGVAGGEPAAALFTRANRQLYERLVTLLVARDAIDEALEVVERSRLEQLADYLLQLPARSNSRAGDSSERAELTRLAREHAALREAARQQDDPRELTRLIARMADTERRAAKLIRELNKDHRGLADTLNIVPNTRAFRALPNFPDSLALVSYFVTDEALYAFVARKGRAVSAVRISVPAGDLRDAVAMALVQIGASRDGDSTALRESLARLHRWLIEPLLPALDGIETLAILPHRWLNYLPFAALYGPRRDGGEGWLLADFRLQSLSAQSYLPRLTELLMGEDESAAVDVLALGNPDLGDPARALPFAAEEVRHIGRLFPPPASEVLLGARASKANLLRDWGRRRIVHLAAHARLGETQAELLLAPANEGVLGIDELFDLAPHNDRTALLVLSACQTAVDPGLNRLLWRGPRAASQPVGPPIASAAHSLLLLGVPAVIATLWKIDDQATALLMRRYYSALAEGAGAAEGSANGAVSATSDRAPGYYAALRDAQLALAARDDRFSRPFYWAGFQYFGVQP